MSRGRRRGTLLPLAIAAAVTLAAPSAPAGPSVWSRARDPRVSAQDQLVRAAQKAVIRYRRASRVEGQRISSLSVFLLGDAQKALARAVASGSAGFDTRLLYAEVLRDTKENDEAVRVLQAILKDRPPTPMRSRALGEIAILHALAGRREEEIRAYTDALAIEPHAHRRASLLANRAEALMATGDVTSALEGYRAALVPLTNIELFYLAPTTLFGMGVALDRIGNLTAGLESIKLARSYDPMDRGLEPPDWFFSPDHDEHWYRALGGWSCGRFSQSWAARSACYDKSVFEWEQYLHDAPQGDRWLPLAHVRLEEVKREQRRMRLDFEAAKKADAQKKLDEKTKAHDDPGGSP